MKLILDRIELNGHGKKIAVFENDDEFINVSEDEMPLGLMEKLSSGIMIEAEYANGKILSAELLVNETEKKRVEMKSRLSRFSSKKR